VVRQRETTCRIEARVTYDKNEVHTKNGSHHCENTGAEQEHDAEFSSHRYIQRKYNGNRNEDNAQVRDKIQNKNGDQKCSALRHAIFYDSLAPPKEHIIRNTHFLDLDRSAIAC
jgi:hypothetical protein